ncbi:MAG TPA: hypothetical protein VN660_01725 [Steroidobacteraceae bacterium]|nr:hypothetical protein [Steroidobacteraceae bacterium]
MAAIVEQMSPALAREVYALKARADLLNERLRAVHRAFDILGREAVDLGALCEKIAAGMQIECPAALPLVTPILDQIVAGVAHLTGRAH